MQNTKQDTGQTGVIVHEWIEKAGGAERVLDAFVQAYPEADVFALWDDAPGRLNRRVNESWLATTPLRRHKAAALPFMIGAWRNMRADRNYDWALVSSHLFAHHASFSGQPTLRKYVYVHTPARYIWTPELDVRGSSPLARIASRALQPLDRQRAGEAASIAANSSYVRERVERFWNRDAKVIHPPVDVERIQAQADWREALTTAEYQQLTDLPGPFILGASRFIPYKRLDLVIAAGEKVGLPVVIAGAGPLAAELQAQAASASVPVRIIRHPSDALLFALYQSALCYVFPAVEDFGIMPVEAMAAGCPVVTLGVGGASESVLSGTSGIHAEDQSAEAIADAIALTTSLDRKHIPKTTDKFSIHQFRTAVKQWVATSAN